MWLDLGLEERVCRFGPLSWGTRIGLVMLRERDKRITGINRET